DLPVVDGHIAIAITRARDQFVVHVDFPHHQIGRVKTRAFVIPIISERNSQRCPGYRHPNTRLGILNIAVREANPNHAIGPTCGVSFGTAYVDTKQRVSTFILMRFLLNIMTLTSLEFDERVTDLSDSPF